MSGLKGQGVRGGVKEEGLRQGSQRSMGRHGPWVDMETLARDEDDAVTVGNSNSVMESGVEFAGMGPAAIQKGNLNL